MTNPYLSEDGRPELRPSWLAFLDVLGFTELIRTDDREAIARLHQLLRHGNAILQGPEDNLADFGLADHHAMTAFTDNIVLGFPIHDDGEMESGMAFDRIGQFQLSMALGCFFVRGGLSFGDAYIDEIAVFGPALLDAYDAETRLARDPRIVITQSGQDVIDRHLEYYMRGQHAPQNTDLKRDRDGQWFIDYLEATILSLDIEGPVIDFESVQNHRDIVAEKLVAHQSDPRIWSKYEWVADYHNDFCTRYEQFFGEQYLIDTSAARGTITSILSSDP